MKKRVQNKVLAILLSCMFMIGLFPTVVLAEGYESESIPAEITSANFSGGKGTEDPYQIANAEDLKAFAAKVNEGETAICGILMSDIDLNPGITFMKTVPIPAEHLSNGYLSELMEITIPVHFMVTEKRLLGFISITLMMIIKDCLLRVQAQFRTWAL